MMSNPTHPVTAVRGNLDDFIVERVQDCSPADGVTTAQCPTLIVGLHRKVIALGSVRPEPRNHLLKYRRCSELAEHKALGRVVVMKEGSHPGIVMDECVAGRFSERGDQCRRGRREIEDLVKVVEIDHNQIPPRFIHLHFVEIGYLFSNKDLITPAMPGEIASRFPQSIGQREGKYLVIQTLAHLGQIATQQQ